MIKDVFNIWNESNLNVKYFCYVYGDQLGIVNYNCIFILFVFKGNYLGVRELFLLYIFF